MGRNSFGKNWLCTNKKAAFSLFWGKKAAFKNGQKIDFSKNRPPAQRKITPVPVPFRAAKAGLLGLFYFRFVQ
jgi:hypothetical protein